MNVLFLAFEGEAKAMGALAARFKAGGHNVLVASCDHFGVTHTRGNIADFFRARGLCDSEFTNLEPVLREVNSLSAELGRSSVDWSYLKRFEMRYCEQFPLLRLAAMDPLMLDVYHHRNIYYHPTNKALFFKNLELHARWVEALFDRMDFDLVYTIGNQYFHKAAAFSIARARSIPFLVLAIARVEDLHLVYDNFFIGTPDYIRDEMQRLIDTDAPCEEANRHIDKLRETGASAYTEFAPVGSQLTEGLSLTRRVGELGWFLTRYARAALFVHKRYRGMLRRNFFLPSYWGYFRMMIVAVWRRITYFLHPQLTRTDLPDGPFVYFPLHVLPENSVLTVAETLDEMECLFQLSKALPSDWRIVVKINPTMLMSIDTHPNEYYLTMNRLPNVQFINPRVPSGAILRRASAAACICGTALLEAAIHGKPGLRWGCPDFEVVDTIEQFDPRRLDQALVIRGSSNLPYYFQACFNLGIRLSLRTLTGGIAPTSSVAEADFEAQVEQLERSIFSFLGMQSKAQEFVTVDSRVARAGAIPS